jgi:hypothetical protein
VGIKGGQKGDRKRGGFFEVTVCSTGWLNSFATDKTRTVQSIMLPGNSNVEVLALSLVP